MQSAPCRNKLNHFCILCALSCLVVVASSSCSSCSPSTTTVLATLAEEREHGAPAFVSLEVLLDGESAPAVPSVAASSATNPPGVHVAIRLAPSQRHALEEATFSCVGPGCLWTAPFGATLSAGPMLDGSVFPPLLDQKNTTTWRSTLAAGLANLSLTTPEGQGDAEDDETVWGALLAARAPLRARLEHWDKSLYHAAWSPASNCSRIATATRLEELFLGEGIARVWQLQELPYTRDASLGKTWQRTSSIVPDTMPLGGHYGAALVAAQGWIGVASPLAPGGGVVHLFRNHGGAGGEDEVAVVDDWRDAGATLPSPGLDAHAAFGLHMAGEGGVWVVLAPWQAFVYAAPPAIDVDIGPTLEAIVRPFAVDGTTSWEPHASPAVCPSGKRFAVADRLQGVCGRVEVFARQASTGMGGATEWQSEGVVEPPAGSASEGCNFGSSVSLRGGVLLVGAPGHDAGGGAVFVFLRSSAPFAQWTFFERLEPAVPTMPLDALGHVVHVAADYLVAGTQGVPGLHFWWWEEAPLDPDEPPEAGTYEAATSVDMGLAMDDATAAPARVEGLATCNTLLLAALGASNVVHVLEPFSLHGLRLRGRAEDARGGRRRWQNLTTCNASSSSSSTTGSGGSAASGLLLQMQEGIGEWRWHPCSGSDEEVHGGATSTSPSLLSGGSVVGTEGLVLSHGPEGEEPLSRGVLEAIIGVLACCLVLVALALASVWRSRRPSRQPDPLRAATGWVDANRLPTEATCTERVGVAGGSGIDEEGAAGGAELGEVPQREPHMQGDRALTPVPRDRSVARDYQRRGGSVSRASTPTPVAA